MAPRPAMLAPLLALALAVPLAAPLVAPLAVPLAVPPAAAQQAGAYVMEVGDPATDMQARAGGPVRVSSEVVNAGHGGAAYAYIVQISRSDGTVVHVASQVEEVNRSGTYSPSVPWTPRAPGHYLVTAFAWSSLAEPVALAEPARSVIAVLPEGRAPIPAAVTVEAGGRFYETGDTVVVRGRVLEDFGIGPVVTVRGAGGDASVARPEAGPDGSFTAEFGTGGMGVGEYEVSAGYGGAPLARDRFLFTGDPPEGAGPLGGDHVHATVEVRINGYRLDLSAPEYQLRSAWAHFEGGEGRTLHLHAGNVTMGYLLGSLRISLDGGCIGLPDGREFCQDGGRSLSYRVNGEQVGGILGHVPAEGDHILVSYGTAPQNDPAYGTRQGA